MLLSFDVFYVALVRSLHNLYVYHTFSMCRARLSLQLCLSSFACLTVSPPSSRSLTLALFPDPVPTAAPSVRQHRLCDVDTPVNPNALIDPPAVIRTLETGWQKHIPLHLLSHSRSRASSHLSPTPLGSLAVVEGGQIHVREAPLDSSGESSMSIAEFFEAWPRFCNLIETHLLSPDKVDIANAFRAHFKTLTSRTDFSSRFHLYLRYDIHIRQLFIQQSSQFSPAFFHRDLWNTIVDDARTAEFQALRSSLNTSGSFRTFPKPSVLGSSSGTNISTPPFLPKKPSFPASRDNAQKPGVCFVCLDPNHQSKRCPRKENGFIVRDAEGKWKAPGDVLLCFRWNGPSGCSFPNCRFSHACTVCGTPAHSAQSHPPL